MLRYPLAIILLAASTLALAIEGTRPAYIPPPPVVSSGGMVQIIFSLLLVLAAIAVVAWVLKRMNVARQGSGTLLKVVGGVAIGQRERIVLVELNDTWLVIGVGPGQIRTLYTLQRPDGDLAETEAQLPSASTAIDNQFSNLISSLLRKNKQGENSK